MKLGTINSAGRPALVVLMDWGGIEGAAIAWVLRVAVDTAVLTWFAARLSGLAPRELFPHLAVPLVMTAFCVAAMLPLPLTTRYALSLGFAVVYVAGSWWWGGVREIVRRGASYQRQREVSRAHGGGPAAELSTPWPGGR